jgi:hypothetical protein
MDAGPVVKSYKKVTTGRNQGFSYYFCLMMEESGAGSVILFLIFFSFFLYCGLGCGLSFAYVAHFVFLRDVWIETQRAAVASRRATNLRSHPSPYQLFYGSEARYRFIIKHFQERQS